MTQNSLSTVGFSEEPAIATDQTSEKDIGKTGQ